MLNLFRRRRAPRVTGAEALTIRDLLDDPRLRAVMGDVDPDGVAPRSRHVEHERRVTADLFAAARREHRPTPHDRRQRELAA